MDEYGIRVLGATGETQIDSTFRNVALRASGSVSLASSVSFGGDVRAGSMTLAAGQTGLLAFRCPSPAVIYGASISGDNVTYHFRAFSTATETLYWYLFDEIQNCPPPVGNYGTVVRDAGGVITFDSRQRYARIVGTYRSTTPPSLAYPGATVAVIQGTVPSTIVSIPQAPPPSTAPWDSVASHGFIRAWGSTVVASRQTYKVGETPNLLQWPTGNTLYYTGTVIDVSGL